MHSLLFTLSALLTLAAVHAIPRPSGVPTCTYSCPPHDQLGFAVSTHSDDGTNLFCSYPAVEGENPNDFFCKYSDTTGALTEDHDANLCAATAVASCSARRRNAVPRAPAPPMAAPVARAPTPEEVKRASLKRRKPAAVEA